MIRGMMVPVAVAAFALSTQATRRRMTNRSVADLHRAREYQSEGEVASLSALESEYWSQRGRTPDFKHAQRSIGYRRLSEFYRTMKSKSQRAASRP
jgi:hypothetical protein